MLIARVYAMLGKIGRVRIVDKVVEWCDNRAVENARPGEFTRGV